MKFCSLIFLSLLVVQSVYSQTNMDVVVPDTLDWQRYFPLKIGNVWEYEVTEPTSQLRREVTADALINGHRYFLITKTWQGATILPPDMVFVRYDTAGVVVTVDAPRADTIGYPRDFPIDPSEQAHFPEHFDLRTAFGDTLFFDEEYNEHYWVDGGYERQVRIYDDTVAVAGLKCLHRFWWHECYAADIGFVGGGSLYSFRLTYVKTDEIEYGVSRFTSVAAEPTVETPSGFGLEVVTIYPNPARNSATVVYSLSRPTYVTLEIFDVLGRRVEMEEMQYQLAGEHRYHLKTEGRTAGIYFIRIRTEAGKQSVHSLSVQR